MKFSVLAISPLQHYNKKVSPAALFTAETKSNTNNYMTIKFNNTPSLKKKTVAERSQSHDDVQPHPEKIVVAPRLQNDATPTATVTPEVGKLTVIVEESRQDLSTHRHSPCKNMGPADRDRQGAQKDLHHSARKLRKTKRRLFLEAVNNIDTSSQAAYYKKSPFRNSTRSRRTGERSEVEQVADAMRKI